MPNHKKSGIITFSICIRKETQDLIDKVAHKENRCRSAMIDLICKEACRTILEKEKKTA